MNRTISIVIQSCLLATVLIQGLAAGAQEGVPQETVTVSDCDNYPTAEVLISIVRSLLHRQDLRSKFTGKQRRFVNSLRPGTKAYNEVRERLEKQITERLSGSNRCLSARAVEQTLWQWLQQWSGEGTVAEEIVVTDDYDNKIALKWGEALQEAIERDQLTTGLSFPWCVIFGSC